MIVSPQPWPMDPHNGEFGRLSQSSINEDTDLYPSKYPSRRQKSWLKRVSGWRGGVVAAIAICSFVLLLNVILTIVARTAWPVKDGIATAYMGNCKTSGTWTKSLHVLINLFGTLLLGASNFCMQRLVAPTRKEVDKAHAKKKWMDIGMPSVRNLPRINRWRALLWLLLGMSSVPLHLFYNSAVFETLAANEVAFFVVPPEFFAETASWTYLNLTSFYDGVNETVARHVRGLVVDGSYANPLLFENITTDACKQRYHTSFVTNGGIGFGVLRDPVEPFRYVLDVASGPGPLSDRYSKNYTYCLSEIVSPKCKVQFSLTILFIVITCNVVKLSLMIVVLWRLNHKTLVTVGDAIESFIEVPDPSTENCCLMSRHNIDTIWKFPETRLNQRWKNRLREPWVGACSGRRWTFSLLLYAGFLGFAGSLYKMADDGTRNKFGKVESNYFLDVKLPYPDSIIPPVLLANLPQTIVSFIYLTYNGLFTCMLAGREWAQYAVKRAPLRVTVPRPGQRSTFFLQLPYIWSAPLLIASVLLHFFVSQSIFLARVAIYRDGSPISAYKSLKLDKQYNQIQQPSDVFNGVGYSNAALLGTIIWFSILAGGCLLVGLICVYPKGHPLGATNSAVISAACHVRGENDGRVWGQQDVTAKPLMWGVTLKGTRDKIGHCSFSAEYVEKPKSGALYAGSRKWKDE